MALDTDKAYRLSVCADCYGTAANGDDWICDPMGREPFNLIPAEHDVTAGWLHDHDECVDGFCDDDLGFSWWACHACGSLLGGDRFKMTEWGI